MFMKMAERQSEVVAALRETIPRRDWALAYVHAEFREEEGFLLQFKEGFLLLVDAGKAKRAPLLVETAVDRALETMHAAYAEAGQAFWRLDLVVEASGTYRFALDDTPSRLLAGDADAEFKGRLDRKFAELAEENGLTA